MLITIVPTNVSFGTLYWSPPLAIATTNPFSGQVIAALRRTFGVLVLIVSITRVEAVCEKSTAVSGKAHNWLGTNIENRKVTNVTEILWKYFRAMESILVSSRGLSHLKSSL